MNAYIERFIRTAKDECLDNFIFFNENHIRKVLSDYIKFYNTKRPHQGINQNIPSGNTYNGNGKVKIEPILNGLHYHYYREVA